MMKIERVVDALGALGVKVSKVVLTDDPEGEDDELKITEEVGVQVGDGYLIANRWSEAEEAMYSGPSRARTPQGVVHVAEDIERMLTEAVSVQNC